MAMGFVKEKKSRIISLFQENFAQGTADEHQSIVLFWSSEGIELQILIFWLTNHRFFYLNRQIGFTLFIYLFLYLFIHFAAVWRDFDSLSNPD